VVVARPLAALSVPTAVPIIASNSINNQPSLRLEITPFFWCGTAGCSWPVLGEKIPPPLLSIFAAGLESWRDYCRDYARGQDLPTPTANLNPINHTEVNTR